MSTMFGSGTISRLFTIVCIMRIIFVWRWERSIETFSFHVFDFEICVLNWCSFLITEILVANLREYTHILVGIDNGNSCEAW